MILAFRGWYGSVLGVSWAVLKASCAILGHLGDLLGAILCHVEPLWKPRGNMVSHCGFLEQSQRSLGAQEIQGAPPRAGFFDAAGPLVDKRRREDWGDEDLKTMGIIREKRQD